MSESTALDTALAGRAGLSDGGPCQPVDFPERLPHGRSVGMRRVDGMALSRQERGSTAGWPKVSRADLHTDRRRDSPSTGDTRPHGTADSSLRDGLS